MCFILFCNIYDQQLLNDASFYFSFQQVLLCFCSTYSVLLRLLLYAAHRDVALFCFFAYVLLVWWFISFLLLLLVDSFPSFTDGDDDEALFCSYYSCTKYVQLNELARLAYAAFVSLWACEDADVADLSW